MKKIALVSATRFEIEPTLDFLSRYRVKNADTFVCGNLEIVICITQPGMVQTAFELGKLRDNNIVMAINAGVAGSFGQFKTGDVVNVTADCFSELGAEDGDAFIPMDALGLGKQKVEITHPLQNSYIAAIPVVTGITVNTVHGNSNSISRVVQAYDPGIESMEGAAFVLAANAFNWQAIQLRAISNRVEKRNKDHWDMPTAISNLNKTVIGLILALGE